MARSSNGLFLALQVPVPATTKNANGAKRNRSGADYVSDVGAVSWPPASRSSSSSQFLCSCPPVSLAPGLGGSGLLSVFFLFCRFGLFGFLLPLPFGLVLLAFLVAHMITPFRRSQSSIPASARSAYLCSRHFRLFLGHRISSYAAAAIFPTVQCLETVPIS